MDSETLYSRYLELRRYVGWEPADANRLRAAAVIVAPCFRGLVRDFYEEIERHPEALRTITEGTVQVARLKRTLTQWLEELFSGNYDADYVARRWRVGLRHVQIGLNQVYVNAAMSRLREGILDCHAHSLQGSFEDTLLTRRSINRALDLELAVIQDAYQTEFMKKQSLSERFATIGRISSGVAHELRNPLNVIKTSVYIMRSAERLSPEKLATHLDRIDRQATMADRVITALSDFARLPPPSLGTVDMRQLLTEVTAETPAPDGVHVNVDCPIDLPLAHADPDQLRIVFSNLIRNAFDAMPKGGALCIAVRAEGKQLHVQVSDTGTGMSPEDARRAMEPFHSTKARGLGLGLAIVRAVLDRHQAPIGVTSQEGLGTTFSFAIEQYSDSQRTPRK